MKKKHKLGHASVILYGRAGNVVSQVGKVYELARHHGAEGAFIIDPPQGPGSPGYQKVIDQPDKYCLPITKAEGGVCPPRQAMLIPTKDCSVVTIINHKNGMVGAVHAGREQLVNRSNPCQLSHGTIERLITALAIDDGALASAYVTGGISATHFEHRDPAYLEPFVYLYGLTVIEDLERHTLDLLRVIKLKLANYGITDVESDELCTYSTPWLGSRRAERDGLPNKKHSNWTLVVNHYP